MSKALSFTTVQLYCQPHAYQMSWYCAGWCAI